MSSQPAVFNFNSHQVRTIVKDGEPWFVAKDVAEVLGYSNTPKAVADHCKAAERMTITNRDGQKGGAQFITIIPERDLYRLIMRSKLPSAERFEEWVVAEVLPQIRKTGGYIPATNKTPEQIMAEAVLIAQATIQQMKPKAIAHDTFIETGDSVSVTTAAAHFGMTAPALTSFLITTGAFRRVKDHGQNRRVPKKAYMNYFTVKQEYAYQCGGEPRYRPKVYITPEGMSWVANKLAERGAEL